MSRNHTDNARNTSSGGQSQPQSAVTPVATNAAAPVGADPALSHTDPNVIVDGRARDDFGNTLAPTSPGAEPATADDRYGKLHADTTAALREMEANTDDPDMKIQLAAWANRLDEQRAAL